MKKALDEANKNIPINTPIPDFLKENKEDKAATDALIEQFPHLSPLPEDNDDDENSPSSPYPIPLPPQQPEPDTDIIKTSLDSVFDSSSSANKDIETLLKEEEIPTNNIFTLDSFNPDHTTLFSHSPSLEYFPQSPFPQQQQQTLTQPLPQPLPPPPPPPPPSPTNYIPKKKPSHGKNVNLMRELYENENNELKRKRNSEEEDEEEDEEEEENKRKKEKSELRVTTKNNRRFHRTLFLKKKRSDC